MMSRWTVQFQDRLDAGTQLASMLVDHWWHDETIVRADLVVLGLPRGGVPVAALVARALNAPLDVVLVRKLGVPGRPEYAMGAIGEGGAEVLNNGVIRALGVPPDVVDAVRTRERQLLAERAERYRRGRERADLRDTHAVIVDDGVATGATAAVACRVVQDLGARRVTLAVPVASAQLVRDPDFHAHFGPHTEVLAVHSPEDLGSVGQYYADFSQTADAEVERLLDERPRQ